MEYCISFEGRCGHRTWFGQWNLSWNDVLFLSFSPQALEKHWIASVRLCGAYLATRRSKQPEILTAHIGQLPGIVTRPVEDFTWVNFCFLLSHWEFGVVCYHSITEPIMTLLWCNPCVFIAWKEIRNFSKARCFHVTFNSKFFGMGIKNITQNLHNK